MNIDTWLEEFTYIAGPCSAESAEQIEKTASGLAKSCPTVKYFRAGVWKPRTKPGGFEGNGVKALPWIIKSAKANNLIPIIEIGNSQQAIEALSVGITNFWVGARTSGDPFTISSIVDSLSDWKQLHPDSDIGILVKNPMAVDLDLWVGALERFSLIGITRLGAIFRGFSTLNENKYRNTPIWKIVVDLKTKLPNLPIICDISHIAGSRQYLDEIAQEALSMGVNGLMVETHYDPSVAITDASQQITPTALEELIVNHCPKHEGCLESELIKNRLQLDQLDRELLNVLNARFVLTDEIGQIKKRNNIQVYQPKRYNIIKQMIATDIKGLQNLDEEFIFNLFDLIHEKSIERQLKN